MESEGLFPVREMPAGSPQDSPLADRASSILYCRDVFLGALEDAEKARHLPNVKHLHVVVLWQGRVRFPVRVVHMAEMSLHFDLTTGSAIRKHGLYFTD